MDINPYKASSLTAVFEKSVRDYHERDDVDAHPANPHAMGDLEHMLYEKNWIDAVQWHLEDIIRRPDIGDRELVKVKRKIDLLNQKRTDLVEDIDERFASMLQHHDKKDNARMNSETPAWILDRLSILILKIYHMREESRRHQAGIEHTSRCEARLLILAQQRADLERCYDELLEDIRSGTRFFKLYRQMKMYNDPNLNPALYGKDGGLSGK